jgi:hypothetical protein
MVIQSLENIIREELNRHIARINLHKITFDIEQEDEDSVIANSSNNLFDDQDDDTKL